jgi:hypothetical protein
MIIRLSVAANLAGTLIATCFVLGSAQAASMPVLKSNAPPALVTLVGRGGGGHGHGGGGHGHGGGKHAHGGGGHGGGGKHAHGGGGKRYYGGGGKYYAHKGGGHGYYNWHKHHGHYRYYGHYGWYGWPSYYGGGCGWLYRRALATDSPYWWDRYYECIGYY